MQGGVALGWVVEEGWSEVGMVRDGVPWTQRHPPRIEVGIQLCSLQHYPPLLWESAEWC